MFELAEKQTYFYPVVPAEELLGSARYVGLLKKIEICAGIKDKHYEFLYHRLVHDFAYFVQVMPSKPKGKPGTLLADNLEYAVKALEKYYQENPKNFDIRYAYAVFTSALLQDIGIVMGQHKTMICEAGGQYIQDWLPSNGPMPEGMYYRLWFLGDKWLNVSKLSTLLIARQVMPASGFNWIAEDLPTYRMWLESLTGAGRDEGNKLVNFLALVKGEWAGGATIGIPAAILKPKFPKATKEGELFVEWLTEGIKKGAIPVNTAKAFVFAMDSGMLITLPAFKLYSQNRPGVTPETVAEQFNQLGLTRISGEKLHWEKWAILHKNANQQRENDHRASSSRFSFATRPQEVPAMPKSSLAPGALSIEQMLVSGLFFEDARTFLGDKAFESSRLFEFKPVDNGNKNRAEKRLEELLLLEEEEAAYLEEEGKIVSLNVKKNRRK